MPDNAGYFHAAYLLTALVYVGYAVLLVRRRTRARRALDAPVDRLDEEVRPGGR